VKIYKIKYIGEDIYGNYNSSFLGKKLLTKGKIYELQIEWDLGMFINNHWIFYIFDDINDGTSRGYELNKNDIVTLRELNLNILLNEN